MGQKTISSSDSGSSAAGKINDNFSELYSGQGGGGSIATGILALNEDAIARIAAAKKHYDETELASGSWSTNTADDLFCLAHGSDFHYDTARYGRFRNFVDGVSLIDAAVVSGDLTDEGTTAEFTAMMAVTGTKVPLQVIGNHERWGDKSLADIASGLGISAPYYKVDYASKKIRIIVLNEYDTSTNTKATAAKDGHWSQTQIDWFISQLDDAITNNYNVLVAMHCVEQGSSVSTDAFPTPNDKGFYQRTNAWKNNYTTVMQHHIIEDIIDAFRNGGSVSGTYSHSDGTTAITLSHSFSASGKFIAYIVGHSHVDMTGYSKYKSDQLYLVCPSSCYLGDNNRVKGGNVSDLPRIEGTKSEDCFNVYGIDTINKVVKIVRVGADMNDLMEPREVAYFDYQPSVS